jgi:hypothetical protein
MKLPNGYLSIRQAIPVNEVSYGIGGLKLFTTEEMAEGQIGYSIAPDGMSLGGDGEGDWRPTWIAVGYETACGDPLFIETADPALPVLTAVHGEGSWRPKQVATSFQAFASSFREFTNVANGRANPVELENNPLSESDRKAFLQRLKELNGKSFDPEFWELMIEF